MATEQDDNRYETGKIYKIVCYDTGEVYVGSTTLRLEDRLKCHLLKHNRCCSKQIIERDNYYIELIEQYPCKLKQELLWRERYYFDTMECINKIPPIVSVEETEQHIIDMRNNPQFKAKQAAYTKKWREKNAVKLKASKKKYNEENKELISATSKIYREKNAETIKVNKAKQYEERKAKGFETYTCMCGGTYSNRGGNKQRHEKTKLHIKYCQNLSQDVSGVEESKNEE